MLPFNTIPFETHRSDEHGYELFREAIWHNSEVCSNCFTQIRTIGPVTEMWLGTSTMRINAWYDRTESGSQEHTQWDYNKRFGTCYCLDCGADCSGSHHNTPLEGLIELVENIFRYTKTQTQYDIDGKEFGKEVRELKSIRDATGYETEIMAIAFSRALKRDRPSADTDSSRYVEAPAD